MAEKDKIEKTLESYNDVFADIVNVLLFDGEQVIKEDELEDAQTFSMYKADGKVHSQDRDVAKYWKNGSIRISFFGFENQTAIDELMPLRVLGYDGASYRSELDYLDNKRKSEREEWKKEQSLKTEKEKFIFTEKPYPVLTLVLYYGKAIWNKPKNLVDCLDIPEKLKPFISDYKMNLFDISGLSDETVQKFKSDFKIIADYCVKIRRGEKYTGTKDVFKHFSEIFDLMSILAPDARFDEAKNTPIEKQEVTNMCDWLNEIENRGIEKGIEQGIEKGIERGIEQGIEQGQKRFIIKMLKKHSKESVAEDLEITVAEIDRILENKD